MKLGELEPGEKFRTCYTKKEGTVLHQGPSGTVVKWGTRTKVRIVKKAKWADQQDKVCEFEAAGKSEVISSGTEVERVKEGRARVA